MFDIVRSWQRSQYRNAVASGHIGFDSSDYKSYPTLPIYMKGRPGGDSLELFYDFKFDTQGEPL